MWGWNPKGKKTQPNGAGVVRNSNGLKDANVTDLFNTCEEISTDMKKILPGEMLWVKGHIGMYYGKIDGVDYVIDSTPSLNGVKLNPMSRQSWQKHGQFPWVDYADVIVPIKPVTYRVQVGAYSVQANAEAMRKRLKASGFDAIIVKV